MLNLYGEHIYFFAEGIHRIIVPDIALDKMMTKRRRRRIIATLQHVCLHVIVSC